MPKTWRSDGPETKQLEKLFREGKLNVNSKPAEVQKTYPIFYGFSGAVFRKNFCLAKDKCCVTTPSTSKYFSRKSKFFLHQQ